MRIWRIGILVAMLAIIIFTFPLSVYAIDDPDSTPSLTNFKVNRNLLTSGDALIYGDYNLPYGTAPDEAVDTTYFFRLLDGDNQIGSITPYPYFDRGYNEGIFAFYFESGIAWGTAYTIRISQNPTYFDDPGYWNFTLPSSAYTSQTDQDDNQVELAINIIAAARRLELAHSAYTLLEASVGGTVLSSPEGENYFRGAIYGIQAMSPDLFLVQVMNLDVDDREWTTEQFDEYKARFTGTWVGTSANASASQFGVTVPMLMSFIFVLPVCFGAIIVSNKMFKKSDPGFVVSFLILTMGALMGWLPAAIYGSLLQLAAVYTAYVVFYARG